MGYIAKNSLQKNHIYCVIVENPTTKNTILIGFDRKKQPTKKQHLMGDSEKTAYEKHNI